VNQQAQKVALPTFLRKRLRAFRVGQGEDQCYHITNVEGDKTYRLETWQFFILETLPSCEDFPKLQSVFEDRFGRKIKVEEINEVFKLVADYKLFGLEAATHPILIEFKKTRMAQNVPGGMAKQIQGATDGEQKAEPSNIGIEADVDSLPAGIRDAIGFDEKTKKGWKLFNPSKIIKFVYPLFLPFKPLVYVLPTLLIAALFVTFNNFAQLEQELTRLLDSFNFIEHVLFGMLTVNFAVTLVTALVAHSYRASVVGFCIVFHFGFFPRFMARLSHVKQLTRRERLWLHAAPILLRLGLFSTGILIWFAAQTRAENVSIFWLAVASISLISLLITVNPLIKSNGYHWLATYVDEPFLKGKAYKALINKFKGNVYREADDNILIAYALASTIFILLFLAAVLIGIAHILKMQLGGAGVLLTGVITVVLIKKLISKLTQLDQAYERSVQFDRWRKRTLLRESKEEVQEKSKNPILSFIKPALTVLFIALMFIPYSYQPGGNFNILPSQKQEIVAELSSIIEEIYFDGGELVEKGTVIGRLDYSEYAAQEKIYAARMLEQKAMIAELKSRPRPEEVLLASRALDVEKTRVKFSEAKVYRLEKLYTERTTSFEELDDARREYRIDQDQVKEKLANLKLVELGASSDQIAAADAKLKSLEEERNYYLDKIEKSKLYMPFNGRIVDIHLQQKIGSFLEKGKPLTVVENTDQVFAQIEIPEPDIGYIEQSARAIIRPNAMQNQEFQGVVSTVAPNVEKLRFGKVVQVVTVLENKDGIIKTGMTGYAKIDGGTLPVWKVFSLAILRFARVEVWSWIP
jgi:putative peptide zinc metalloprotease protein